MSGQYVIIKGLSINYVTLGGRGAVFEKTCYDILQGVLNRCERHIGSRIVRTGIHGDVGSGSGLST